MVEILVAVQLFYTLFFSTLLQNCSLSALIILSVAAQYCLSGVREFEIVAIGK